MNDSNPPEDNVISFDSFKRKDGQRSNNRKSPPKKKEQNMQFGASSDHVFNVEPGKIIECKIYSSTEGGYLVKVGETLTAFLSSDKEYDFGMIVKAQIVCEKDGYLLLSDQMDEANSSERVLSLIDSSSDAPENIVQLKAKEEEEDNTSSDGQCIPFKPNKKNSTTDPSDEPS